MKFETVDHKGQQIDKRSLDRFWLRKNTGLGRRYFDNERYECSNDRVREKMFIIKLDNFLHRKFPDLVEWDFDILRGRYTRHNYGAYNRHTHHNVEIVRRCGDRSSIIVNTFAMDDMMNEGLSKMADEFIATKEIRKRNIFYSEIKNVIEGYKTTKKAIIALNYKCTKKDTEKYVKWCKELPEFANAEVKAICSEGTNNGTLQWWQINVYEKSENTLEFADEEAF